MFLKSNWMIPRMMEDGCAENLRAATDADVLKQGLEDVNLLTEKGTRRQILV